MRAPELAPDALQIVQQEDLSEEEALVPHLRGLLRDSGYGLDSWSVADNAKGRVFKLTASRVPWGQADAGIFGEGEGEGSTKDDEI